MQEGSASRREWMVPEEQGCGQVFARFSQPAKILAFMLLLAALACAAQTPDPATFHLLYQFKSGRDGSSPYSSLILDAQAISMALRKSTVLTATGPFSK
jgi:hypothetical protein